ncbi:MAG: MBL fold metallo-hydrolase [Deltaproteobacteria bacterium]|nr:MBL fold metallo-hydrolase [Deltaproteobacteria bacterium]
MSKNGNWRIKILVNNSVPESPYLGEHGISFLIENISDKNPWSFLFDTGQTSEVLLSNAEKMRVNWVNLRGIALSHGHYDHTGGLLGLLEKLDHPVPIIYHPEIFKNRISMIPHFRSIGVPFKEKDIEKFNMPILRTRNEVYISDELIISGEIPREYDFEENGVDNFFCESDDKYVKDNVMDDKAVIIRLKEKGIFLICGCCHAGLINTLKYAYELTKEKKVFGIIGGLHMAGATDERIEKTIEHLKKYNPSIIVPMHCTGIKESAILWNVFKDKIKFLLVGESLEI